MVAGAAEMASRVGAAGFSEPLDGVYLLQEYVETAEPVRSAPMPALAWSRHFARLDQREVSLHGPAGAPSKLGHALDRDIDAGHGTGAIGHCPRPLLDVLVLSNRGPRLSSSTASGSAYGSQTPVPRITFIERAVPAVSGGDYSLDST